MQKVVSWIRSFFIILWMLLSPFAMGVWLLFHHQERYDADRAFLRFIRWGVQKIAPIQVEVVGREHLTAHQPCIFLNNHQHTIEAAIIAEVYPPRTVVVAKMGLRKIPIAGWIFEKAGNVFIDRGDLEQSIRARTELAETMRRERVNLWIFPEGRLNTDRAGLGPFKKGPFHMAIQLQAPLVPVVFSPSYCLLDAVAGHARPGRVWIKVLEPISTAGLTAEDVEALRDMAYERMSSAYEELAARAFGFLPHHKVNCENVREIEAV
jgi:lysophosphatidate acyltransferase